MTRRLSVISLSLVLPLLALTLEGVHPVTVHAAPAVPESSTSSGFTLASVDPQNAVSSSVSASSAFSGSFSPDMPPTPGQGHSPSHVLRYGNFGPGMMSSSINLSEPPSDSSQTQKQPTVSKRATIATSGGGILCQYDPVTAGVVHCSDGATYKSSSASLSQPQQPSYYVPNVANGNVKQPLKKRYTPNVGFAGGSAGSGASGVHMLPPVPARSQGYSIPPFSASQHPPLSSPVNSKTQKRSFGDSDSSSAFAYSGTNDYDLGSGSSAAFNKIPSYYGSGGSGGGNDVEDWGNYEPSLGGGDWNMYNGESDLRGDWSKYSGGSGYGSSYNPNYGSGYGGSYSGYGGSGYYSGKPSKGKRSVTAGPSSAPNVVPVPIDIDTLVYPDGQMTLMPSGGISAAGGPGGPGFGGAGGPVGFN
ncbi:hypothetical protein BGX26_010687 [Mortierella sp. AD094]|nr:hypothetical protein BGX26_010687 [Mortierella sp. AD094]